jgi:hypothetical protein
VLAGCASSQHDARPVAAAAAPAKARCRSAVRRVSLPGRAGIRPQIAVAQDTFAVAWEEEGDERGVRLQLLDASARPRSGTVALTDGGAASEPRLVSDGDGFALFWTVAGDERSSIAMRRVDGAGIPRGPSRSVVVAPGARALAAARLADGFVLLWWLWSSTPHTLFATFLDGDGRAVGRALPITDAPSADPTVDVAAPAELGVPLQADAIVAWEQLVDGVEHVILGRLDRTQLVEQVDLGRGESPALGDRRVIFERPEENRLYAASIDPWGGAAKRLSDGHTPAAARRGDATALCFIRDSPLEEGRADELWCGTLHEGQLPDATKVALAPRGLLALELAAGPSQFAVAYQVQEEDDTSISFAALTCPDLGGAPQARR